MTDAEHGHLVRRFEKAAVKQGNEIRILGSDGKVRKLPLRIRLRLRVHQRIDVAACWLVDRGCEDAAVRLWRACRMW